ncbi:MAG: permease [Anaerolineaceae bacterium]|nr:permease [Anaerolineaceae bacterium]
MNTKQNSASSVFDYKPIEAMALLIALGVLSLALSQNALTTEKWSTFTSIFLGIFIEAIPFLLLGTIASGLVEVFVEQNKLKAFFPDSPFLSALYGSLMGLLFPVCECGVVPLVRRLFRKGLPIPTGVAFLMAAPVINPIVILSTLTAFGFGKILFMRLGFTMLISVVTGLVFASAQNQWEILRPTIWIDSESSDLTCHCCGHAHDHDHDHSHSEDTHAAETKQDKRTTLSLTGKKLEQVLQITLDELFEIGRYLIGGAIIAAAMQTFIPQTLLISIGQGPVVSVLVMMALAVILSICSTVDAFVALGFTNVFSTGSILAFLVFGPIVDIKSILMFSRTFKLRSVIYMVLIPMLFVLLISISMNLFWAG